MEIYLNAVDVFSAAVELEERGQKFYSNAALQTFGYSQKILQQLAEMEKEHVAKFKSILANIEESSQERGEINSEEEQAFLKQLTNEKIITGECRLKPEDGPFQILHKAMHLEKNAVFFYTAVKDSLREKMSQESVDQLISEEMKHYRIISSALKNLDKKD